MTRSWRLLFVCIISLLLFGSCLAQNEAPATTAEPRKTPAISTNSRLLAAKTVCVKRPRGNLIPYNVISSAFEGWGRYAIEYDEAKADLIVDITAPQEASGFSVSSSTSNNSTSGYPEQSTKSTKEFSNTPVRMVVIDAKTKTPLWSGSEQPKSAMRRKGQQDNQVEAAQSLFSKFHDRVEPPLKD
jgi:hypothetical protein